MTTYSFPHLLRFIGFVVERHRIYERREEGQTAPWTKDKILAQYRFCNVYRELDRTTKWIAENWRTPYESLDDLWFFMVIARLVNRPETLVELPTPGVWKKAKFLETMNVLRKQGHKTFGSAYIVSTGGQAMPKAEYLAAHVLDPMWTQRERLRPRSNDTLSSFHQRLMGEIGMGSFMAAQVVADIKYVQPLLKAKDWWTFASSGPGSRMGMIYLIGSSPGDFRWQEHEWRTALRDLSAVANPHFENAELPRIHAQDLQNCLCEFSKYRRTQLGTGKPKQLFTPFEGE